MIWLSRLIPSRAALWGALATLGAVLLAWVRMDARRDAKQAVEKKDLNHAKTIADRVSDNRADPDRLRPYDGAGYRD